MQVTFCKWVHIFMDRIIKWSYCSWHYSYPRSVSCRQLNSRSLGSSLRYTNSYSRFLHIFHTTGEIQNRKFKISCTDLGWFAQLWQNILSFDNFSYKTKRKHLIRGGNLSHIFLHFLHTVCFNSQKVSLRNIKFD